MTDRPDFNVEIVPIASLRPHPRNYRSHPDDQITHLQESISEHGLYRNVVIARDGTILAGHGVVTAAQEMSLSTIPAIRLDIDPESPQALKVLTGDNEIEHLAEQDDRLLSQLLKEIHDADANLLGTGFDEMMLANLVMVTRPAHEIRTIDEAAQWVGMPDYESGGRVLKAIVSFETEEDRADFLSRLGLEAPDRARQDGDWSLWWPPREIADRRSLMIEESDAS